MITPFLMSLIFVSVTTLTQTERCQKCGIRGICNHIEDPECKDFYNELTQFNDPVLRKRTQNPKTRQRKPCDFIVVRTGRSYSKKFATVPSSEKWREMNPPPGKESG